MFGRKDESKLKSEDQPTCFRCNEKITEFPYRGVLIGEDTLQGTLFTQFACHFNAPCWNVENFKQVFPEPYKIFAYLEHEPLNKVKKSAPSDWAHSRVKEKYGSETSTILVQTIQKRCTLIAINPPATWEEIKPYYSSNE